MFPMTLTIHNPAQLNAVLAALQAPLAAAEPTTEDLVQIARNRAATKEAAAPGGKPSAASTVPSQPTAEAAPSTPAPSAAAPAPSTSKPEPQPTTAPAAVASFAAEPVTYDQVARAITAGVKAHREHVVATLRQFGATKGPELKPAQYSAFMAALAQPEAVPA